MIIEISKSVETCSLPNILQILKISEYTYFKEDVLTCMKTLIDTYGLKAYVDPEITIFGLLIWLENDDCKIRMNALSSYPKSDVTFDFYKKKGTDYSIVLPFMLFIGNYNIDENEYKSYLKELNMTVTNPDEKDFAAYRRSLIIAEKIILKYYMPVVFPAK